MSQVQLIHDTPTLWWLSFADAGRPQGQQFLGALALEVPANTDPIQHAWAMKLNPGGEVLFAIIPEENHHHMPEDLRNRLLSREEAEFVCRPRGDGAVQ